MRNFQAAVTFIIAVFALSPSASAASSQSYSSMDTDALLLLANNPETQQGDEICKVALPVYTELRQRFPAHRKIVHRQILYELHCALEAERTIEAYNLVDSVKIDPSQAEDFHLALRMALRMGDTQRVRRTLELLANEGRQGVFVNLNSKVIYSASRAMYRDRQYIKAMDRIGLALFDNPDFAALDDDLQKDVAAWAFDAALEREDFEKTASLLNYVDYPKTYIGLLTDRKYEPVWDQVENRAGTGLRNITAEYAKTMLEAYSRDPTDPGHFVFAAHALYFDGRWQDVLALSGTIPRDVKTYRNLEENEAWVLNLEAYTLDVLGRRTDADRVFDRLALHPIENNNWIISQLINRASRLVGQGRWEEGLQAADKAAEASGSDAAKMIIARDRACAYAGLGNSEKASEYIDYLAGNDEDSPIYAAQGLMCSGLDDRAAKIVLAALRNEDTRGAMIINLQPVEVELFYPHSILPHPRDLVESHPEVKDNLLRYGRIIPERFYPAASIDRQSRMAD